MEKLNQFKNQFIKALISNPESKNLVFGGSFVLLYVKVREDEDFVPKDINLYCSPEFFLEGTKLIRDAIAATRQPFVEKDVPYYYYINDDEVEENVFRNKTFTAVNERITLTEYPLLLSKTHIFEGQEIKVMLLSPYLSSMFLGVALVSNVGKNCVDKAKLISNLEFMQSYLINHTTVLVKKLGKEKNVKL